MEDRDRQILTGAWAARFAREDVDAAATLRLESGVEALLSGDDLWLRGSHMSESLSEQMTKAAPAALYARDGQDQLIPAGLKLPVATLPAGKWTAIATVLTPTVATALLPAHTTRFAALTLIRSGAERPANLLETSIDAWASYVDGAPAIRLSRLSFAAADDLAIVRGSPLPSIPGRLYSESSGVAVPCGFEIHPAIDPASLRQWLELPQHAVALFADDGSYEQIPGDAFVHATRSAVRTTVRAMAGGNAR